MTAQFSNLNPVASGPVMSPAPPAPPTRKQKKFSELNQKTQDYINKVRGKSTNPKYNFNILAKVDIHLRSPLWRLFRETANFYVDINGNKFNKSTGYIVTEYPRTNISLDTLTEILPD
jgi:hypothetical protein